MNLQDIFYHGVRDQIRRVISQMTDQEIERGLDAFQTGGSNWSHCFFARALPALELDSGKPESKLREHFGLSDTIPIKIIYCTFDGASVMARADLAKFIHDLRFGSVDDTLAQLKAIDFSQAEKKEIVSCAADRPQVGQINEVPWEDMKSSLLDDEWQTGQGGY